MLCLFRVAHTYGMDGVLHNASQEEVYKTVCEPIMKNVLDGYNGKRSAWPDLLCWFTFLACDRVCVGDGMYCFCQLHVLMDCRGVVAFQGMRRISK